MYLFVCMFVMYVCKIQTRNLHLVSVSFFRTAEFVTQSCQKQEVEYVK